MKRIEWKKQEMINVYFLKQEYLIFSLCHTKSLHFFLVVLYFSF